MTDQLPEYLQNYFDGLNKDVAYAYEIAKQARKKGFDPETVPEIQIAKNMAERVVGLVSVLAPQIVDSGIVDRIIELEKQYSILDWRVAFVIALEVAQQKYCSFEDEREAMEVGIRVGFAYVTNGVVSSPLEGFSTLELMPRRDNSGKYFRINYSGPIRNAGGTAAATSVLIADYVRKHMGYAEYDPTEDEIKRCYSEIGFYHERVANLQYFPAEEEIDYLLARMPVEVAGDPSEKFDVPNYKNLPRIPTNKLRSGYCLIYSSCIPLKAPKLWKQLSKWGDEMGMSQWNFLKDYLDIQHHAKAKSATSSDSDDDSDEKVSPVYTYIKDLVAGRPVFGHPMRPGGFRLRFGRSRLSGLSGQSLHPATMVIANEFIATGTQLKVERPGKAAAYTPCDTILGPIVRLKSGDVVYISSEEQARKLLNEVEKILFLGDVLICYGDFLDRAHPLIPPGYCEEWWVLELEKAWPQLPNELRAHPTTASVSFELAVEYSQKYGVPLHPKYTFYYLLARIEQLELLRSAIVSAPKKDHLVFKFSDELKEVLEVCGIPHKVVQNEYLVCSPEVSQVLRFTFSQSVSSPTHSDAFMEQVCPVSLRDKAGIFIGARMGRPEKAKMRKLTGSPHVLFPVGEEGGRLRSFNEAIQKHGKITSSFYVYDSPYGDPSVLPLDPKSGARLSGAEENPQFLSVDIRPYVKHSLDLLGWSVYPDLIKGVRGMVADQKHAEHLVKGFLRAHHEVCVNKDGTIRYDASEVPVTHFRPSEIGIDVELTKKLGYVSDIHGLPITDANQVIEMFPQDVILPACDEAPEEKADDVLLRAAQFVDDLLTKVYKLPAYYNAKVPNDLVGKHIIALAPHTSAGTIGRIIGFSNTQGLFYHPYLHCATRRDCFSKETIIPLKKDGVWSLTALGDVVESESPSNIVDSHGTLEKKVSQYSTIGYVDGVLCEVPVNNFTKHTEMPMISFKTRFDRTLKTTANHKHIVLRDGKELVVPASELVVGDKIKTPYSFDISFSDCTQISFIDVFSSSDWLMVRGLKKCISSLRADLVSLGCSANQADNFSGRDSVPVLYASKIIEKYNISHADLSVSAKYDSVVLPAQFDVSDSLLQCFGLYVAEGFARNQEGIKGSYQVYIAAAKKEIRSFVQKVFFDVFGVSPSENKTDRVTFSSRILYSLFTDVLGMGHSAYEKRLPNQLLSLPKSRLGKILSGYLEGDGSVSRSDLRITFDTVSNGLKQDLSFAFARFGAFVKYSTSTRKPGKTVAEFYENKGVNVPFFTCSKGVIQSKFVASLSEYVQFISSDKKAKHELLLANRSHKYIKTEFDDQFFLDESISLEHHDPDVSYCLNVPGNSVIANGVLTRQCDGDEGCVFLVMDAFLNFSKKYLPSSRGGTMDAPLVLTTVLVPAEVDDMVFQMDTAWEYPLEFYEACCEYKMPWEIKIPKVDDVLGTPAEFFGLGFTHDTQSMNAGCRVSAYKTLPTMQDKLGSQMDLAEKIMAVDEADVAKLVIDKHFIRDLKGNLRKFSMQVFRCVSCNEKYRRPPLQGSCTSCRGKIIFTISEGSVVKYLEPAESLVRKYNLDHYTAQSIDLTRRRVEEVFGKDPEKQLGLGAWFG